MPDIKNIFVLMMENRSFDHMLGFSGITGTDAESGTPTQINWLNGTESNNHQGQPYPVMRGANETMPVDPGHEFLDVLEELCGTNAACPPGGASRCGNGRSMGWLGRGRRWRRTAATSQTKPSAGFTGARP